MNDLSGMRTFNMPSDFWNTSTITWGAIWGAIFHYLPLLWKHRQFAVKEVKTFYMFFFIISSWAYSDSFFIMALLFTKLRRISLANACGKQSMNTFGTFPLLVIASEFKTDKTTSDLHYEPLVYPDKFDFIFILKQVIAKSKQ